MHIRSNASRIFSWQTPRYRAFLQRLAASRILSLSVVFDSVSLLSTSVSLQFLCYSRRTYPKRIYLSFSVSFLGLAFPSLFSSFASLGFSMPCHLGSFPFHSDSDLVHSLTNQSFVKKSPYQPSALSGRPFAHGGTSLMISTTRFSSLAGFCVAISITTSSCT